MRYRDLHVYMCYGPEEPCCIHKGMPWFNKTLPLTTATIVNAELCVNEYEH